MSMSRSAAENVRTFRLLTCHAPKGAIYKNYIKLVWFLIIRYVRQMSRHLWASMKMPLRAAAGCAPGCEAGEGRRAHANPQIRFLYRPAAARTQATPDTSVRFCRVGFPIS